MQRAPQDPAPKPRSRVFALPSSRLGRDAVVAMAASIVMVVLINVVSPQGPRGNDVPVWQEVAFLGIVLGLVASGVMGLVAVFRRHERSWLVLLPTALISVAMVNELVQGFVQLLT